MNQELEKLLVAGEDGHRLSLKMRNSYRCNDGLAVHTYTDDRTCSKSDAKAQVCKAALVELLLRAPNRGSVRLLDGAQLTRNGWSVERIWDEVRRIQLQMHGISGITPDDAEQEKAEPLRAPEGGTPSVAAPQPWCTHRRPCQPHRHHQREVQASMQHLPIRCLQHLPSSRHLQDIPQPQHRCRRCRRCQHVLLRRGHQVLRLCGRCRGTCSP